MEEVEREKLLTVEEVAVRSSIQVFLRNGEGEQFAGFGSGFMLQHRERYFLVSVRHVTDYEGLTTCLETGIPDKQQDRPGYLLKPVGGLYTFDLFNLADAGQIKEVSDLFANGEALDITFAEIKENFELRQPALDFKAFQVEESHKMILDSRDIALPTIEKTYCFYGRIKHNQRGIALYMENTFKHSLKFHRTDGYLHIFKNPEIIRDPDEFRGCSGAPIIDSDGLLVGVACAVRRNTLLVYGFSIHECIKLLNIAIDTKML